MKRASILIPAALLAAACSATGGTSPATGPTETASSTPAPATYHYSESPPTSSTPPAIQKGDFTIGLKTLSKHCFGTIGCDLTVEPTITYAGTADKLSAYGKCNVTYTITGDETGDVTSTAYGQGGTRFQISQSLISTASTNVTPKASVTDVDCS